MFIIVYMAYNVTFSKNLRIFEFFFFLVVNNKNFFAKNNCDKLFWNFLYIFQIKMKTNEKKNSL